MSHGLKNVVYNSIPFTRSPTMFLKLKFMKISCVKTPYTTSNVVMVEKAALAGVAQWIEHGLQTKGSPVQFLFRAHAWVVGQVPSRVA